MPGKGLACGLAWGLVAVTLTAATCADATEEPMIHSPKLDPAEVPRDLGEAAYRHVADLVAFGPRYTGSPGWQRGLDYIAETLAEAGLEPVRDRWTDQRFGVTFENVHATLPGSHPDRILLACHHDTKRCEGHPDPDHNFPFVGANDSGSGVGLLLALAPLLAAIPEEQRQATVQIVFFDGEECLEFDWDSDKALFGSKRFTAQLRATELAPDASRVRAMVLVDMVGAVDLQIDEELFSDPDLREIIRAAARACGHESVFFQRSMQIKDDHLPFLQAGIPAINLIDLVDNPQWHTPDDTLEHISAASLQIVGEVVLTALPAVERAYFPRGLPPHAEGR